MGPSYGGIAHEFSPAKYLCDIRLIVGFNEKTLDDLGQRVHLIKTDIKV